MNHPYVEVDKVTTPEEIIKEAKEAGAVQGDTYWLKLFDDPVGRYTKEQLGEMMSEYKRMHDSIKIFQNLINKNLTEEQKALLDDGFGLIFKKARISTMLP